MTDDRRNDLGTKIIYAIIYGVLSLFVFGAWSNGVDNTKGISRLQANYETIRDDLKEIKDLLKRRIPTGG